ncbi:Uncharacterised protein [Sporosarcina pasteurii]|uniref:Uncharacterized protein n=1 Tax=Sporosarcina pasteurii TaxID=1474 RepID=A0A380BEY8_SPOPA|nr:Uncharacterised protein [Sporosarcina pasteurii]
MHKVPGSDTTLNRVGNWYLYYGRLFNLVTDSPQTAQWPLHNTNST